MKIGLLRHGAKFRERIRNARTAMPVDVTPWVLAGFTPEAAAKAHPGRTCYVRSDATPNERKARAWYDWRAG